jgi:hypothetical protein
MLKRLFLPSVQALVKSAELQQSRLTRVPYTIARFTGAGTAIGAGLGFFGGTAVAIVDKEEDPFSLISACTAVGAPIGGAGGLALGVAVTCPGVAVGAGALAATSMIVENNRKHKF